MPRRPPPAATGDPASAAVPPDRGRIRTRSLGLAGTPPPGVIRCAAAAAAGEDGGDGTGEAASDSA